MSCLKVQFINSRICQNSILILVFFPTSVVFLIMFSVRLLSELMILIIWQIIWHVPTNWACCNKPLSCNLILKIKIAGKYSYFSSGTFWFWSVKIWYLKLSIQAHTLEAVIQNHFQKHLEFVKNIPGILLWNQIFPISFIAISSSFLCKEMMHTLRNLKH